MCLNNTRGVLSTRWGDSRGERSVDIYTGIGLGAYIKSKSRDDMRVNSAFTFGEKAFLGWNFGAFSTEAYIRHFSNGSLTDKNSGHNFVGASISYNF
ncbi:acyloxyacyl hydrolase [Salmonella enterica]|uniref:acyloxyacyl hydrolase n=1 Tax=Salmonella enterica TaxID=28901 RepID=UPI0020CAD0DA|nr:acyloxyacyl hydrolase [Salmonella enterica]